MPLTQSPQRRLLIQHAMTDHAIYHSPKVHIQVDPFRAPITYGTEKVNVLQLRACRARLRKKPVLKIPLPANDNLVPLR